MNLEKLANLEAGHAKGILYSAWRYGAIKGFQKPDFEKLEKQINEMRDSKESAAST